MLGPPPEQFGKKFNLKKPMQRKGGKPGAGQDAAGEGQRSRPSAVPAPQLNKTKPKVAAKPLVPITDKMRQGKEPLRTFGDLLQYMKPAEEKPPVVEATTPVVTPDVEQTQSETKE